MKLEIKHLAPYLPYGLKIQINDKNNNLLLTCRTVVALSNESVTYEFFKNGDLDRLPFNKVKPILRPLSDLTKEITVNGETFVPIAKFYSLTSVDLELINIEEWHEELIYLLKNDSPFQLSQFNMLLEWHFDIFGLIENGLSIDINTLYK